MKLIDFIVYSYAMVHPHYKKATNLWCYKGSHNHFKIIEKAWSFLQAFL